LELFLLLLVTFVALSPLAALIAIQLTAIQLIAIQLIAIQLIAIQLIAIQIAVQLAEPLARHPVLSVLFKTQLHV